MAEDGYDVTPEAAERLLAPPRLSGGAAARSGRHGAGRRVAPDPSHRARAPRPMQPTCPLERGLSRPSYSSPSEHRVGVDGGSPMRRTSDTPNVAAPVSPRRRDAARPVGQLVAEEHPADALARARRSRPSSGIPGRPAARSRPVATTTSSVVDGEKTRLPSSAGSVDAAKRDVLGVGLGGHVEGARRDLLERGRSSRPGRPAGSSTRELTTNDVVTTDSTTAAAIVATQPSHRAGWPARARRRVRTRGRASLARGAPGPAESADLRGRGSGAGDGDAAGAARPRPGSRRGSAHAGRPAASLADGLADERRGATEPHELVAARRAAGQVRGDRLGRGGVAGHQPVEPARLRPPRARAVRASRRGPWCPYRSSPAGTGTTSSPAPGPNSAPRPSRRRRSARRVRVLTVPSGQPSRSAISVCDRSSW